MLEGEYKFFELVYIICQQKIRNFIFIAPPADPHGKSTIADKISEYAGTLQSGEMEAQFLDSMDLERTIKAQSFDFV